MRIGKTYIGAIELIISINVVVFIIEVFAMSMGRFEFILNNFALIPEFIIEKPWTIITSIFLHADAWHLFLNMFVLYFFGLYLERLVGERNFLRTYFIGGICASAAYLITSFFFDIPPPSVPAIGASGAVFAVMGALVVLRPRLTILVNFFFPMPLWMWAMIYTFIALTDMLTTMGGVAHNAHLGGLIAGIYLGNKFKRRISGYAHDYFTVRYY
ncbi:MAG: rhomboid family intramembrane serine protease [Candidatus Altiarchaeales archaeon]|nr:MAG: rhomboid family intramembrane serine protease [Candidatus Altiarchaeales archaeon]RLI93709.1 MAG: rhomboid family intramembrane serine protease [Candidatus Altiarchaeales archaeon]RLI93843.1 MAG: rhomboid family intramembrane serine protease [Candidatus Altiarchaeales archaeon]HDO82291.1 rhomboid family intramembrane serine protease [Candidatus Altiarchaeales archaeon]HEX54940.1 rhomboid family intramembrane serine protease [Candidatus Altiarchaeales archaeon]